MGVEFEMAFHRDMTQQEKLSHLSAAEQHGWDASYDARQSTNSGLLAQIQLYMAIIKGRSAEINERLGVGAQETRKKKDDALSEIAIAVEKVRELCPANLKESTDFAETWTKRLGSQPNAPAPAPAASAPPAPIPSNITSPSAVELDTSPRFHNTDISSLAELDISGQLTTACYLQSDPPPAYY